MSSVSLIDGHIDEMTEKERKRVTTMQNDMRDRLAELLSTNLYGNLCDHCGADNDFDKYKLLDMTADYLIANGVVPVVHCKDCKHYKAQKQSINWKNKKKYCCRVVALKVNENDYCSYGEM